MEIIDKLETIHRRWDEMGEQLNDPSVMADMKRFVKLNKDYKDLEPVVAAFKEYKNVLANIDHAREVIKSEKDDDFRQMALEELDGLQERKEKLENDIRLMLIPKDPQDSKNAIVEIRAGSGGDEASIFAGDLFRMYLKYCESKGWKTEVVDMNEGTVGGFKEVVFNVIGDHAYGIMKFESGVHRVQRVPKTETQAASIPRLPRSWCCQKPKSLISNSTRKIFERILSALPDRRTVGEHHLFCHPPDAHPNGHCGFVSGRKVAVKKFSQSHESASEPHL